jgi:hypothetical protein
MFYRVMTISEEKSDFSILAVVGTSQGLLSLVFDKSPSGIMLAVCFLPMEVV